MFQSREDLLAWVQNVARSLGYVIVTKRSKTKSSGYVSKVILMCDRGGVYKSRDTGITKTSTRNSVTKKINCPFELVAKHFKLYDVWTLRVIRDEHNHAPAMHMEGHPYAMRLTDNENRLVVDLSMKNVKPRDILSTLKEQDVNNASSLRTVYNARVRNQKTIQAGNTPMQLVFSLLQVNGYDFEYRTNSSTNELEELYFVHPISLMMWRAFPHVLLMDTTYKTNRYMLPFMNLFLFF